MKTTLFSLIQQTIAKTVVPPQTTIRILVYAHNRARREFARRVTLFAAATIVASVFIVPMVMTSIENSREMQDKILETKLDRLCEYTLLSVTHFKVKPVTIDFDL